MAEPNPGELAETELIDVAWSEKKKRRGIKPKGKELRVVITVSTLIVLP